MIINPTINYSQKAVLPQCVSFKANDESLNSISTVYRMPSAELLKTYTGVNNVNFAGRLDPQNHEKAKVQRNLKGEFWGHAYGVDYMTSYSLLKSLGNYIDNNIELSDSDIKKINTQKANIHNFNSLLVTNEPIKKPEEFDLETRNALKELKTQLKDIKETFKQAGLSDKEVNIFNKFVANTFLTLYFMGFPDAVGHAGQVTRKNIVEAYKFNASNENILKSAIVGWLHDPKLKANISWSNLATHPVIGGAIALTVLDSKEFDDLLVDYLPDNKAIKSFKEGIVESLFVNNDSAFVLQNVVLNKPVFPVPNPQDGVASNCPDIVEVANKRLDAPSEGKKPDMITSKLLNAIKFIKFDTGIKALNIGSFGTMCNHLSSKYPVLGSKQASKVLDDILNGKISNPDIIFDLNKTIKGNPNSVKPLKIKSTALFCHHDEVSESGKIPSLALVISDPLLLSPHKVLIGGMQKTPVERIKSYISSFNDNVKAIPFEAKENALCWQLDLYTSMLKAADELSSQNNFETFNECFKDESFDVKLNHLIELISTSSTWGEYADFEINDVNKEKLTHMYSVVANHYKQATETSEGMFKI
ncbi:MAG: hypothetical protein AB7V50_07430 [Vampirovibrionia bacterium]